MPETHDVVIVGAGPTGIFTAYEIKQRCPDADVIMLDLGPDLEDRRCPAWLTGKCTLCSVCSVMSGFGGAGAFSDGKINISDKVGGSLYEFIPESSLLEIISYVDRLYVKMGAPKKLWGTNVDKISELKRKAYKHGFLLIPYKVRHMGLSGSRKVLSNFKHVLKSLGVEMLFGKRVEYIITKDSRVEGVQIQGDEVIKSKFVVAAPGRVGADWLVKEAKRLSLGVEGGRIDLGVRVEVPAETMREFTDVLYEPKLVYYSKTFDDKVRMFCVNPGGEVITESYWGIVTVNGLSKGDELTENTNFALLVSTKFTEPFENTISYALDIARLANNIAGNQPLIQRLGDLVRGRRSTPNRIKRSIVKPTLEGAVPGDLSFVLPYRYLTDIIETLKALNELMPGIYSDHTLLYGVEIKLHTAKLELSSNLESVKIKGLYAGGDAAGVSRGLLQASASGVIIGRDIASKLMLS